MRGRRLLPALTVLLLVCLASSAAAGPEIEAARVLVDARMKVDALAKRLGSGRATNDELIDDLEAVADACERLRGLLHPPAEGGQAPALPPQIVRDAEALFGSAEKRMLAAFRLERRERAGRGNAREVVNGKAAELLGSTGRESASRGIIQALEQEVFKRKEDASVALLDTAFRALAALGHPASVTWMVHEFSHSMTVPRGRLDQLLAAHRALPRFELARIPGRVRREAVGDLIRAYLPVERRSFAYEAVPSIRDFWRGAGPGVLRMLAHLAGGPQDENGRALRTVAAYGAWWRVQRRQPW